MIAGHLGWVRCVSMDASNEWFVTGSADRTIKVASLFRLSRTDLGPRLRESEANAHRAFAHGAWRGGVEPLALSVLLRRRQGGQVLGPGVQSRRFRQERSSKVVRSYHGHLSGVYCITTHPTLDVLLTGGRDSVCRVWDIRTKAEIMVLGGHRGTVHCVATQAGEPQVVTGSADATVRTWDLVAGTATSILTHHKKGVRSCLFHPV